MTTISGAKVELVCWCGAKYHARLADIKRGWGRSCCKSHAAIKRDFGRENPIIAATGQKVKRVRKKNKPTRKTTITKTKSISHDYDDFNDEMGWNAHKDSF